MASLDDEEAPDPRKEYVKLVSKEGHVFVASKESCMSSGTIRAMLTGPGIWKENEGEMPTIKFEEISSDILEKTLQYFHYKMQYDNTPPPFPPFKIDVDQIVPLLKAANFLDT